MAGAGRVRYAAMTVDERFEDLLDDISGFYRSWLVYIGLELDLLETMARTCG